MVLMVLMVGCAGGDPTASARHGSVRPRPSIVPWNSAPPSYPPYVQPTAPPAPTGMASCDVSALRIGTTGHQGAMGSLIGSLDVVNSDEVPCLLRGPVTVTFRNAHGDKALTASAIGTTPNFPGWAALGTARIQWEGFWCDRRDPLVTVEVLVPGAPSPLRASHEPVFGGGACESGMIPGGLTVWPLGPTPTPPPTPPPPIFSARIDAPKQIRAGETLDYLVTLTNVSTRVIPLDPCPNYAQG